MPRIHYEPKNMYCRASRLNEELFLGLLWLWLNGLSAQAAHEALKTNAELGVVSAKTIGRYFRGFGFRLSEMTLESQFSEDYPLFGILKDDNAELYSDLIEVIAERAIRSAFAELHYDIFAQTERHKPFLQVSRDLSTEIRRVSAARNGIKSPKRGDVALAIYRVQAAKSLSKDATSDSFASMMFSGIVADLRERPMNARDI